MTKKEHDYKEFDGTPNHTAIDYISWCEHNDGYSINIPGNRMLLKKEQIKSPEYHLRLHTSKCPNRLNGIKDINKLVDSENRMKVVSNNLPGIVEWLNDWGFTNIANDLSIIWQDCCDPAHQTDK